MYGNEYGYNDNPENKNRSQGAGTYTDYIGYGSSTNQPDMSGSNRNNDDKNHRTKKIFGIIGIALAGIMVGSLVCYVIMNTHFNASIKVNGEELLPQKGTEQSQEAHPNFADGVGTDDDLNAQNGIAEDDIADSGSKNIFDSIFGQDEDYYTTMDGELDETEDAAADGENASSYPTTGGNGNMSVAQIAEKCLPSVVAITNMSEMEVRNFWGERFTQQSQSAGSGIIVGESDAELLILTNYHVVENNKTLSVVFNGEDEDVDEATIINAVIKDYNQDRDIAVIAVNKADLTPSIQANIAIATIGDSEQLVLGEQVVAIGNALGYGQSVTTGIVSALDRPLGGSSSYSGSAGYVDSAEAENTYIQTDAAINPGNSGGAMFNMRGELVGVNSAKMGGSTIEGMGYAIPITDIIGEVDSMMNHETKAMLPEDQRGYLGVSIVDVTAEIGQMYNLPEGVYISVINPGLAADKAGLEKEEIIVALNGKTVKNSAELKEELAYHAKGETVTVTVEHMSDGGYIQRDVDVVLGELGE